MFIRYGMSTFLGEELPDGKAPLAAYAPTDLDLSQWIKVAKDAGMNYAVSCCRTQPLGFKVY